MKRRNEKKMSKHFKLRKDIFVDRWGILLYRIEAVEDIPCQGVNKGDIGGFVQYEDNLSDNAWVAENAKVLGNARIFGDAKVSGNAVVYGYAKIFRDARVFGDAEVSGYAAVSEKAEISGYARVFDRAEIFGDARVYGAAKVYGFADVSGYSEVFGDAKVYGDAIVCGDARVCGNAEIACDKDYIVFKNFWSSGRYFTWTRSNNMWRAGCFYGTGEELVKKAYKDSEKSGDNYKAVVDYVNNVVLKQGGETTK